MRIDVDLGRCQGHTLCAITAPELFDLDDSDGHAVVKVADGLVPAALEAQAHRAFQTCPERAITLAP